MSSNTTSDPRRSIPQSQRSAYRSFRLRSGDPPEAPIRPERALIPSELPGGPVNPPIEAPSRDEETKDEQLPLFTENKRP
jgi:hypothetical protein